MAQITLVEAINLALKREMERDPAVVVLGQDVGVDGGVFRATLGLAERFAGRVIDTPLAEALIAGMSIGMAVEGMSGGRNPVLGIRLRDDRPDPQPCRPDALSNAGPAVMSHGIAHALRGWHPRPRAPFRKS